MSLKTPFHYDFVGSFLRPQALKKARVDFSLGKISKEELTKIEDECIVELITKIKKAGYHVITDGEFRRATWHLDFMWGVGGVAHKKTIQGLAFNGEPALIDDTFITSKLSYNGHPFVEHFKFVKQFEDENTIAKQTVPSPAQFYAQFTGAVERPRTLQIYSSVEEFADDVVAIYKAFIADIYAVGCRNIQFDDCVWGALVNTEAACGLSGETPETIDKFKQLIVDINNRVIDGKPSDLQINTHVCRGNYHSTFFTSGAYTPVASYLFGKEDVDAYYLEFDDERSGGFECLKHVSGDKKVVLGLVTTKKATLEDEEKVIARLNEATKYVPLDRLYLSPQCGFASCEIGNKIEDGDQWAKLELVKKIAQKVWND